MSAAGDAGMFLVVTSLTVVDPAVILLNQAPERFQAAPDAWDWEGAGRCLFRKKSAFDGSRACCVGRGQSKHRSDQAFVLALPPVTIISTIVAIAPQSAMPTAPACFHQV